VGADLAAAREEAQKHAGSGGTAIIGFNTGFPLGFLGSDDFVMSFDEWHRVGERLREAGVAHEQVTCGGVGHGFFCGERPETYDKATAEDAWRRTLDALARYVADTGQAPVIFVSNVKSLAGPSWTTTRLP